MSVRVSRLVWRGYDGPGGSAMTVMLALADWCDDSGNCWPSLAAIAQKARIQDAASQTHS